jgi:hypothetical protein
MRDDILEVYEVPDIWTPEHVLHRMVLAYEVLARLHERTGPQQFKVAWPEIVHDAEDRLSLVSSHIVMDMDSGDYREETMDERDHRLSADVINEWERNNPPTPREMTLMNEAFGWPGRYLLKPIFITRWAARRAKGGHDNASEVGMAMIQAEAKSICQGLRRDRVEILPEGI